VILTVALLVANCRATSAEPAAPPPAASIHRDAAVQYWQAFATIPAMDQAQRDLASTWDTAPLDAAAVKLIEDSEAALTQLHRGSACDRCDWGLNREDSFGLRLPHLVKARELSRLACLRARYRLTH